MDPNTTKNTNTDLESIDPQLQNFFRNSLHWEEYFGSSVDLTRAILSIYDKFVSVNDNDNTDDQQTSDPELKSDKGQGHTDRDQPATSKPNQRTSSSSSSSSLYPPAIQTSSSIVAQENGLTTFDKQQTVSRNKATLSSPPTIYLSADNMLDDDASLDSRKRPLSISSMSSASSSSLPRHSCYKRLNMTDSEVLINGPGQGSSAPSASIDNTDLESVASTEDLIDSESIASSFDGTCRGYEEDRTSQIQDGGGTKLLAPQEAVYKDEESGVSNVSSSASHHLESYTLQQPEGDSSSCRNSCSPSPSLCELLTDDNKPNATDIDDEGDGESGPSSLTHYISYIQRVVTEIVETEQTYVKCLKEMKEGYLEYLDKCDEVSKDQIQILFGNIVQIYSFSQKFLQELELCEGDPLKVAECFVKNKDKFVIYGHYCTNYPSALETLTKCMAHQNLADIFKQRQLVLGHNLPLGAYLLKPVQRVLKYHLLLQNILKHYDEEKEGFDVLCQALTHMTSMAQHINEMKRKHEHAVRVQEIQSQLLEYDGADLTTLGDLVIEGSLRIVGTKTYRQVFLFEKAVLITKKKEEGMLSCKSFIACANLMLIESIPKEPMSFQVIPFDNPKSMQTLQARNMEQKMKWCQEIKHLILESYKGKIPEKVRHLVMELGRSKDEQCEKLECLNTFQLFDASNSENVDPGKRHQISGLDYLEKRGRVRRKSSNLIPDFNLLKPQKLRKGYRRSDPGFPRLIFPSENKQWFDNEAAESVDDEKTGTLINRRRGGPPYPSPEPEAGPEVESEAGSESGYDLEKYKTESLPEQNSSSYRRAPSFRNAITDNPQHIPEIDTSSVSCLGSSCGSVQSTPAQMYRPKNTSLEPSTNGDPNSVKVPTKYASMPSLNNEKVPVVINIDPSSDASSSAQSLVHGCQGNSSNSGNNQLKKNTSGKSEVQSKLSTPTPPPKPKRSFKNVLPLLRQAKMAGLLPGITFKYYHGSEAKTRRSSDPPVSYEDPWVKKSELHQSVSQNEVSTSQSLRRSQLESPNYKNMSRESLDWLVYLNRNQLNTGKFANSIQTLAQTVSKEGQHVYQEVPSYATLPRGMTSPTDIPKSVLHKSLTFCDKPANPRFMRSYSTPPSKRVTPDKDEHPASSIAAIKESQRMVEEMENYMRAEGKVNTLAKFPMKIPEQSDAETDHLQTLSLSRHASQTSLLSNSSQSSYESNLGSTESLVSQIQSFPTKVANWKASIKSPTPPVFTLPPPSAYKRKTEASASVPTSPLSKDDVSLSFLHYPCTSTTESLTTSLNSPISESSVSSPTLNTSKDCNPISLSCSPSPQIASANSSPSRQITSATSSPSPSPSRQITSATSSPLLSPSRQIASATSSPLLSPSRQIASATSSPLLSPSRQIASATSSPLPSPSRQITSATSSPLASPSRQITSATSSPLPSPSRQITSATSSPLPSPSRQITSATSSPLPSPSRQITSATSSPLPSPSRQITSATSSPLPSPSRQITSATSSPLASPSRQIASATSSPLPSTSRQITSATSSPLPSPSRQITSATSSPLASPSRQIASATSSPLASPVRVESLVFVHDSPQKSSSVPSSPFHLCSAWDSIEIYPQYHSPAKPRCVSSSPHSTPERCMSIPLLLPVFSTPTKIANYSVSNPAISKSCPMTPVDEDMPSTELNTDMTPDETNLISKPSDQLSHATSTPEIEETTVPEHESSSELSPNKCQYSSHSMPSLTHIARKSAPSSPAMSSKVMISNTSSPPLLSKRSTDRRNSAPQNFLKEVKSALKIRHQSLKLDHNVSLSSLLEGVPSTSLSNEPPWSPNNCRSYPSTLRCASRHYSSSSDDVFHKKSTGSHENFGNCQHLYKSLSLRANLQPSDSAFSIQSGTTEDGDTTSNSQLSTSEGSFVSMDSVCEQQFVETELFRDSAVYCDMDIEPSPIIECPLPPKASIKEYVQYLEEKHRCSRQPKMSGAKKREPSQMIRQRLRSLQEHARYKSNRHSYEEEVSELSQTSVREINQILTRIPISVDDSRCPYHSTASIPLPTNLSKCSRSLGSLDQLNCEPVNTKGWVRKVVTKFQTDP